MDSNIYQGCIVLESLEDSRILNDFSVLGVRVTSEESPAERWHLFTIQAPEKVIKKLSLFIKPQKWYAHFWNENKHIIAIFRDHVFEFDFDNKTSWEPAIQYGLSVGIPHEQLDFLIS